MYKVHDVFISYRRKEADGTEQGKLIADAVYRYLTGKGLKVFLDHERMENGPFPEQLRWQVTHAPNFVFIATGAAMRFRPGPDPDYVAEELRCALDEYQKDPEDRTILPVIPYQGIVPGETDPGYPDEIHRLFLHNASGPMDGEIPSERNLKDILRKVTAVNRGNLWNAGYRWLEESKRDGRRFASLHIDKAILPLANEAEKPDIRLPIHVHTEENADRPLMDMIREIPGHLYLIGEGGIGKTTALMSIMEHVYGPGRAPDDIERHRLKGQVPLFVELSKAPDTYGRLYEGGNSTFIRRAVYQQIRQDLKVKQISSAAVESVEDIFMQDPETAVRPIEDLFTMETNNSPEYVLLLDGLNEVSRTQIRKKDVDNSVVSMVIMEINHLMTACPNVRVILTGRSRESAVLSGKTTILDLSGIKDDAIGDYMKRNGLPETRIRAALENTVLREVLRIPLFLIMYAFLDGEDEVRTRGEILHQFFSKKKSALYGAKLRSRDVEEDVKNSAHDQAKNRFTADMQSFLLDFILPEIAHRLVSDDAFRIGLRDRNGKEGLRKIISRVLTDQSDTAVCGENGIEAFTDYREGAANNSTLKTAEEIRKRLEGDTSYKEEVVVTGILDHLTMAMGILVQDMDQEGLIGYGFIHHHIRDYFAAVHEINRLRMAVLLRIYKEYETARRCLEEWKEKPLHAEIRRFIGEALGEAHNVPVCDEAGNYHYSVPPAPCDRNLIRRIFDIYRERFEGGDGYALWNLIQILKEVRKDLSGEDLSRLDLTGIRLNGICLGQRGCSADLHGSKMERELFMPGGHTSTINSAVWSPDGKKIVTAARDSTARVWDAETFRELGILEGHTDTVTSAAWDPDGRKIVTASEDHTVRIWDAETFLEFRKLEWHTDSVYAAAWSPDGRKIATASKDNTACVWDTKTFQILGTLAGHTSFVTSVSWSPDGRKIVTASWDNTARVWDAETFRELKPLEGHSLYLTSAAWSPDGRKIVTTSWDKTARIWDAETFRCIRILEEHLEVVSSAAWSLDSRKIVTTSWDNTVRVWDAETFSEIGGGEFMWGGQFRWGNSAAWSPDGKKIVIATDKQTATIRDVETFRQLGMLEGRSRWVSSAAWSPDSKTIVTKSDDRKAKIWDAESFRELEALAGLPEESEITALSSDGRKIVTAWLNYTAKVLDADTRHELGILKGHSDFLTSMIWSRDCKKIMTTSDDFTARVWDAEKFCELGTLEGHTNSVRAAAWSSDGRKIVTASNDHTAKVWDAEKFCEHGTLKGHTDSVNSADLSPDGRRVVTRADDNTVRIWDSETFCELGQLEGHTEGVNSSIWSKDGTFILTASYDGTARIWSAETYQCIHVINCVPGLEIIGCNFRNLHPESRLSDEDKHILWQHGAEV